MKKIVRLLLASMMLMALVVTLAGCGAQAAEKVIRVGTNATFPPFEMQENSEFTGFDMDLIKAIGQEQGYTVEINHMDFKALIPALGNDKIDAAIAGMSITPERMETVDFSEAYFNAGLIIAVADTNETIKSTDDLKGKKLAAQNGTIGAAYCDGVKALDPTTEVRIFDDIGAAFMDLEKGGVDAVVNDHPVTAYYIKTTETSKAKMVGEIFSADDHYGIAVKKGNQAIKDMLDEGLEKIKANGKYDEIYKKWF